MSWRPNCTRDQLFVTNSEDNKKKKKIPLLIRLYDKTNKSITCYEFKNNLYVNKKSKIQTYA